MIAYALQQNPTVDPPTAWWVYGGFYAGYLILLLASELCYAYRVEIPASRPFEEPTQVGGGFSFLAGMAVIGWFAVGVMVLTSVPDRPPSPTSAFLLLIAGAGAHAFLVAAIERFKLADGGVSAVYAIVVDAITVVLAALGAWGITGLDPLDTLAWANVGSLLVTGVVGILFSLMIGVLG